MFIDAPLVKLTGKHRICKLRNKKFSLDENLSVKKSGNNKNTTQFSMAKMTHKHNSIFWNPIIIELKKWKITKEKQSG